MSRTLLETRGALSAAACMQASPCGTTVTLMGGYWQIKQVVDREGSQDVQVAREHAVVVVRICDCDSLSCGKWISCQDRLGTDDRQDILKTKAAVCFWHTGNLQRQRSFCPRNTLRHELDDPRGAGRTRNGAKTAAF